MDRHVRFGHSRFIPDGTSPHSSVTCCRSIRMTPSCNLPHEQGAEGEGEDGDERKQRRSAHYHAQFREQGNWEQDVAIAAQDLTIHNRRVIV